jgi:hypothetical protein
MTSSDIDLKCGKKLKFPSMFINIKNNMEARILRNIITAYKNSDGINQIDGIYISIKDWNKVSGLIKTSYIEKPNYPLTDRTILIDPSLYLLFSGFDDDKISLSDSIPQLEPLQPIINEISKHTSQRDKIYENIDKVYPLLDSRVIYGFIESQITNNADIIMAPTTPISSQTKVEEQIKKNKEMNRASKILFDTVFSAYKDKKDFMNVLPLRPSVIKTDNLELLKDAILINNPDQLGVQLLGLDETNSNQISLLLKLIKDLSETNKPLHILNVREFGYVTFCYGANSLATPIAVDPYPGISISDQPIPRRGSYYHYLDMTDDSYEILLGKTRPTYDFPCHCEICIRNKKAMDIGESFWNEFRRVHFLLVKNMEMKELRERNAPLKDALRDKFSRSSQTVWIPYLN